MNEAEKTALFNQIYRENRELIFRLCRGFLGAGQEAEDLFQEIFLKVWNNLDSFRGQAKVSTWIYRIGTNTALLYTKRKSRRQSVEATLGKEAIGRAEVPFSEKEQQEQRNRQLNEHAPHTSLKT